MRQIEQIQAPDSNITQQGFTLIESLVAMVMFLGALAGIVPIFMTYRIGAIRNQIKTGAIAVAQDRLDEIRNTPWDQLPTGTGQNQSSEPIEAMGKEYSVTTTYCPTGPVGSTLINRCDTSAKAVRIEVSYDNQEIIEIETIYTDLEE